MPQEMKTGRPRRAVARLLGPLVLLGLLPTLAACDERLTTPCAVVVDGTGSDKDGGGFAAGRELDGKLVDFLRAQSCGKVNFAPIALNSEASLCREEVMNIDPDFSGGGVSRDDVRKQMRKKALESAQHLLACIHKNPSGSDVLGGLKVAIRERPDKGPFHVLVVSDFIHADGTVSLGVEDLSTPEKREALINRFADGNRIADLSGATVYGLGFGQRFKGGRVGEFSGFEAFWQVLLKEHAKVADFKIMS